MAHMSEPNVILAAIVEAVQSVAAPANKAWNYPSWSGHSLEMSFHRWPAYHTVIVVTNDEDDYVLLSWRVSMNEMASWKVSLATPGSVEQIKKQFEDILAGWEASEDMQAMAKLDAIIKLGSVDLDEFRRAARAC